MVLGEGRKGGAEAIPILHTECLIRKVRRRITPPPASSLGAGACAHPRAHGMLTALLFPSAPCPVHHSFDGAAETEKS